MKTNGKYKTLISTMEDKGLNRIKVVLVEKRKTGKWLAEQLDINPTTVSRWCSNKSQPELATLANVARLLNVEMKELLNNIND